MNGIAKSACIAIGIVVIFQATNIANGETIKEDINKIKKTKDKDAENFFMTTAVLGITDKIILENDTDHLYKARDVEIIRVKDDKAAFHLLKGRSFDHEIIDTVVHFRQGNNNLYRILCDIKRSGKKGGGGKDPIDFWYDTEDCNKDAKVYLHCLNSARRTDDTSSGNAENEFYCVAEDDGLGSIQFSVTDKPVDGSQVKWELKATETQFNESGFFEQYKDRFGNDVESYKAITIKREYKKRGGATSPLLADHYIFTIKTIRGEEVQKTRRIYFAIIFVDLDCDTDNDGKIVIDNRRPPISREGENDDLYENTLPGKIVVMGYNNDGEMTVSESAEISLQITPKDVKGKLVLTSKEFSGQIFTDSKLQQECSYDDNKKTVSWELDGTGSTEESYSRIFTIFDKVSFDNRYESYTWKTSTLPKPNFQLEFVSEQISTSNKLGLVDNVQFLVSHPVSDSPRSNIVRIWAPLDGLTYKIFPAPPRFDGNTYGTKSYVPKGIIDRLAHINELVFHVYTSHHDNDQNEVNNRAARWASQIQKLNQGGQIRLHFHECSYRNFQSLGDAGILIVHSHWCGGPDGIQAAFWERAKPALPGWNQANRREIQVENHTNAGINITRVDVARPWFDGLRQQLNRNSAIVWHVSCFSADADQGGSLSQRTGGRARLGYTEICYTNSSENPNDPGNKWPGANIQAPKFFAYMAHPNGYATNSHYKSRTSGAAHNVVRGENNEELVLTGENGDQHWTTICPTLKAWFPVNKLSWPSSVEKGQGAVIFDTYMDSSFDGLLNEVGTQFRWVNTSLRNNDNSYAYRFRTVRKGNAVLKADRCRTTSRPRRQQGRRLWNQKDAKYGFDFKWNWEF